MPVTIIKPTQVEELEARLPDGAGGASTSDPAHADDYVARLGTISFQPGTEERRFVSIPEGATWATLRVRAGAHDAPRYVQTWKVPVLYIRANLCLRPFSTCTCAAYVCLCCVCQYMYESRPFSFRHMCVCVCKCALAYMSVFACMWVCVYARGRACECICVHAPHLPSKRFRSMRGVRLLSTAARGKRKGMLRYTHCWGVCHSPHLQRALHIRADRLAYFQRHLSAT